MQERLWVRIESSSYPVALLESFIDKMKLIVNSYTQYNGSKFDPCIQPIPEEQWAAVVDTQGLTLALSQCLVQGH